MTGQGVDKTIVFGMVERDGEVVTCVVETASRRDMFPTFAATLNRERT